MYIRTDSETMEYTVSSKYCYIGLQYQNPMPMPDHYIHRNHLLDIMVAKLTEKGSTQSPGTTINISGMGGIGKSTLAKALCHDLRIRNCFLDGFLWIRLGPLPISPAIKLGQLYHLLTNRTEVGNQTFFTDKLQSLVTNHLHKLLIIIDDVWEVSDALVYIQVFNGCKIIMTTRRENVNKLMPSKMSMTIERMNEEEAIKLLAYDISNNYSSDEMSILADSLQYWPLLLQLIHGYLHVSCVEHHKTLDQAVDHVQGVMKDKAFDVDKHKSAVVATVKSVVEMLTPDEIRTLKKLVLSVGLSMPIPIALLPAMLKLSEEVIQKLCRRLLQLALISHSQLVTAPNNKIIPCYEVHPIIMQYIMDHMTFESPTEFIDLGDLRNISTVLAGGEDSNISYHCLATIAAVDTIILPNHIRSLYMLLNCLHHEINNCIIELSVLFVRNNKVDLTREVLGFKGNSDYKCVERLYNTIAEDWRKLSVLLVDDKHDEAVELATEYVKNHPLQKAVATFTAFIKDKLNRCKGNRSLVTEIRSHTDRIVRFYKAILKKCCEHARINLRRDAIAMVKSGNVTVEQYQKLMNIHDKDIKLSTDDND